MAAKRKYRKVSCHTTKTAAKAKAKSLRAGGKTAKVVGKCVFSAGARKGAKVGARRRRRRAA